MNWKPIDDDAKDGRELLIRDRNGIVHAGYYGVGRLAYGAGASANWPWTILDHTNGVNHLRADVPVEYIDLGTLVSSTERGSAHD